MRTLVICSLVMGSWLCPVMADPTPPGGQTLLEWRFGVSLTLESTPNAAAGLNEGSGAQGGYSFDHTSFVPTKNTDTVDWTESDWFGSWGTAPFTIQHAPAPGTQDLDYAPSGGEWYDVEAIYLDNDADYIYISVVTSFPFVADTNGDSVPDDLGFVDPSLNATEALIRPGDLSISLFESGTARNERNSTTWHYDYGLNLVDEIRPNNDNTNEKFVGGYSTQFVRSLTLGSNLYATSSDLPASAANIFYPTTGDWYTGSRTGAIESYYEHTNFDPIHPQFSGTLLGNATFVDYYEYSFPSGNEENDAPTYVIEAIIPRSLLGANDPANGDSIGLRWIMGCRNDGNSTQPAVKLIGDIDGEPLTIGDRVWIDDNGDSLQDGGETGLASVTVGLFDMDNAGTKVGEAITDGTGYYLFGGASHINMLSGVSTVPTTVCVGISATTDDVEQIGSSLNTTSSDLELGQEAGVNQTVGLRFNGLTVPQGATVTGAYIQFTSDDDGPVNGGGSTPFDVRIWGDDADDAADFLASSRYPAARTKTTASADWTIPVWAGNSLSGANQRSADLSTVIQEIVDRGGWAPGNSMAFIIEGLETGERSVEEYGENPSAAAQLCITWEVSQTVSYEVTPGSNYEVRVDITQGPLSGYSLVTADAGGDSSNDFVTDLTDSDAVLSGNDAEIAYVGDVLGTSNLGLDFGFSNSGSVAVGNLVFADNNANGVFDAGDSGIDGVTVELWASTDDPNGGGVALATTVTVGGGFYLFDDFAAGYYILHIPKEEFQAGGDLIGRASSSGAGGDTPSDDDADENGIDVSEPNAVGLTTATITLAVDGEPTGEAGAGSYSGTLDDNDVNLTVDFGVVSEGALVGIGNLVFVDADNDGLFDVGEGADNVSVELYTVGDTPGTDSPLRSTLTAGGGLYDFLNLAAGSYFAHIPAAEFGGAGDLNGMLSLPGSGGDGEADDDVDENGVDDASASTNGISSATITLAVDAESTDAGVENGTDATSDNGDDDNTDLTVDFGFYSPAASVSLGNLIFIDADADGVADAGEGVDGVTVELYLSSQTPATDPPLSTTTTAGGGLYEFVNLAAASYIVHVPASEFGSGQELENLLSISGAGADAAGDDDADENGIDAATPVTSGISTGTTTLSLGGEPLDALENGINGSDDSSDANGDWTVDLGFIDTASLVGLGNIVFIDADGDGIFDSGEGVGSVTVELYAAGDLPGSDAPVATTTSGGGADSGEYAFTVIPGSYFVHIPASEFGSGQPLENYLSLSGADSGTNDDAATGNDNGIDDSDPASNGISTADIVLSAGGEALDAVETGHEGGADSPDANFDYTIDLGFTLTVRLGDTVWYDANNSGSIDGAEVGIQNVSVQLFGGGDDPLVDAPLASDVTDASGNYLFSSLLPDDYFVYIPASEFSAGQELENLYASNGGSGAVSDPDDNIDSDNNGAPHAGGSETSNGVRSADITLAADTEPTDDGDADADSNLSLDLGFTDLSIGNYVWSDTTGDGLQTLGEVGLAGVTVTLHDAAGNPITTGGTSSLTNDTFADGTFGDWSEAGGEENGFSAGTGAGRVRVSTDGSGNGNALELLGNMVNQYVERAVPDLSACTSASVDFTYRRYNQDWEAADNFFLEYSTDGGTNWNGTPVWSGPGTIGTDAAPVAVSAAVPLTANAIRLRNAADITGERVYIDDIVIVCDVAGGPVQAVTDASGYYNFSASDGLVGGVDYQLRVDLNDAALGGLLLTGTNADGVTSDDPELDDLDSDADDGVTAAGYASILFTAPFSGINPSYDFGFGTLVEKPDIWAEFQSAYTTELGTDNLPGDNPDGDWYDNLTEYALCTHPGTGVEVMPAWCVEPNLSGGYDILFHRAAGGLGDVRYIVEGAAVLGDPTSWTDIMTLGYGAALPAAGVSTTSIGDGAELVKIANINGYAPMSPTLGFVRLRIELDTDLDGTLEATSHSHVFGWQDIPTYAQCETCSVPFLHKPIFTGSVDSLSAPDKLEVATSVGATGVDLTDVVLLDGTQYYIEVVSGDHEGQRWDLNEVASDADTLVLDLTSTYSTSATVPVTISADNIAVRRHWTLAEIVPLDDVKKTGSPSTADKTLFYDPTGVYTSSVGSYEILWAMEFDPFQQWRSVHSEDSSGHSNRVVGPAGGFYLHRSETAGTLRHAGLVRENQFCQPLVAGANLMPNPYPVEASAADWQMSVATGFSGSNNPGQADQIMLWLGDGVNGTQEFGGNFLLNWTTGGTTYTWWAPLANSSLTNENDTLIFKRNRGAFIKSINGKTDFCIPAPWSP